MRIKNFAHLVERDGSLRCSLCDMPLGTSTDIVQIFTEHIQTMHGHGKKQRGFQPSARIVSVDGKGLSDVRRSPVHQVSDQAHGIDCCLKDRQTAIGKNARRLSLLSR
jgi:hypothetical protein